MSDLNASSSSLLRSLTPRSPPLSFLLLLLLLLLSLSSPLLQSPEQASSPPAKPASQPTEPPPLPPLLSALDPVPPSPLRLPSAVASFASPASSATVALPLPLAACLLSSTVPVLLTSSSPAPGAFDREETGRPAQWQRAVCWLSEAGVPSGQQQLRRLRRSASAPSAGGDCHVGLSMAFYPCREQLVLCACRDRTTRA
ncbi:hypothetical protein MPTK1_6g09690 [Marchantia polymorpha subsp. ruderalis]|uniref:Pherophorin domain-containing protein n=2 Tax=Marchantia polymorpha TaxID=3197 RepID=A0AAF6BQB2_MARPO|nr:hypothetical protein MARPO_0016s0013 [Marchantia polymorpha]BBN14196.1 hypothetical protein Mp_6g09690 [Marchantia polymorpha subsp. ruderalis]|eukprot:PTQ44930.1 hypothetical protein MARPO_0016s0013 [Marchantia polymorpha]